MSKTRAILDAKEGKVDRLALCGLSSGTRSNRVGTWKRRSLYWQAANYFSVNACLVTRAAVGYIQRRQSIGVQVCLKHFNLH